MELILMNGKEMKKMTKAIESLGVNIVEFNIGKHIKLRIENPETGTIKLVTVSKTPKSGGIYHEVKSSVRKVFRKDGEKLNSKGGLQ
tara:strand:- start:245 stop:505 length:261 start_codon:yes stop_codon:yes gene_type:complete